MDRHPNNSEKNKKIYKKIEKTKEIRRKSMIFLDCESCEISNNFKLFKLLILLTKKIARNKTDIILVNIA
jgi:hypothetical protein